MHVRRFCLRGRRRAAMAVLGGLVLSGGPVRAAAPAGNGPAEVTKLATALAAASGRPEGIARLAALLDAEDMVPPSTMVGMLRDFVDGKPGKKADPLLADQAAYRLSLREDGIGEVAAANAHRARLGFIGQAWVLGPFDAQGRSGLDRAFPVETDLSTLNPSSAGSYPGKERPVSWRRAPAEAFVQGALFLDALVRPDNDAVAYVLAYIQSDRDRWVALRVGSPGPVKAWLGGGVVFARDVVRPTELDQDASPVFLRRGNNALVIKTVVTRGAWRLLARLTEPDGRPLVGVQTTAAVPEQMATGAASGVSRPVHDLGKVLRERAQPRAKGEAAVRAWMDYARFLSLVAPADAELRATEEAAKQAVAAVGEKPSALAAEAFRLLGDVAREDDDRRAALEKALPAIKDAHAKAVTLAAIGQLWRRQRRDHEAIARWNEAVVTDPACVPANLSLARQEQQSGLLESARSRLTSLPAELRKLPSVQGALADVSLGLGRRREAEALFRSVYDTRRTDVSAIHDSAAAARARGDLKVAAALYAEATRWRPDLVSLVFDRASILEGQGDVATARQALREAMARLPDDAGLPEELARLEARNGHPDDAIAHMRRSLALRPQNPGLRRYLESLVASATKEKEGRSIDELVSAHAANAEPLAREALATARTVGDVAAAEVLLDRTVVRVHGNGLAERFVQRLVHLRTERAATDGQEVWIRYEPGRQEVEVRKARVFRQGAGGIEISEATGRDERDLSEPWYGLYYDSRAEVVVFENLRAGDIVEIQYSLADVAYANELSAYFGDFQVVADRFPTRRWDYTLIAPKQRTIYVNAMPANMTSQVESRGDETVYRFSADRVPRIEAEPAMPGIAEVAPYLHVSTYKSWAEVGRWYWNLVSDQMQDDGSLKKAALAATEGLSSIADKVKAIHHLVVGSTRYVGLEFGIHGYKPYKSTQVLERRFGDCKDKASLIVSLLRAVGVESEMVLLRTRHGGTIAEQPASLAVFDHAIAYVPALELYLDGTAEFSGVGELPSEDQGVMALRVSAKGATPVRTPVLPAASNLARRLWKVELRDSGAANIVEGLTVTGQAAHEWREHYQTEGERRERYAKVWNGRYAGTVLNSVFMDVGNLNRPVTVQASVQVPRLGDQRVPGQMELPLSSREADFTSTYARLGHRQWPLVLGYPWQHEEELRYSLPSGARVVHAPSSRRITSRFGEFTLSVEEHGTVTTVKSTLLVERNRIEPADYAAFRAFMRDTDAALAERLIVDVKGGR